MFGMGAQEILIILAVALIFIGPKKLPEIARTLGKGYRDLRNAADDLRGQIDIETLMEDQEEEVEETREEPSVQAEDESFLEEVTHSGEMSTTTEPKQSTPTENDQEKETKVSQKTEG